MDDLINKACENALNKLKGKTSQNKDVKKIRNYKEQSCSVGVVEKAAYNELSCDTDQAICNIIQEIEDEDSDHTPEVDPKLLLYPTVCTIKLDNMGLFNHKSFNFVDGKELIDLIYIKSNPKGKNEMVKSQENSEVESIVIANSDDDNHNENNESNDAANVNNNDDDEELIENNMSEAERVLLPSNLFKKPKILNFNHLELLKNPDFENSLNQLNIDVNALVNGATYLKDGEDTNEPCTSEIPPATSFTGTSDTLLTSGNPLQEPKEITVNSERNRAVNLPTITEVRRSNRKLLTAEVPPVQTQNSLIQSPWNSKLKATITNYPKIAPTNRIINYDLAKLPTSRDQFQLVPKIQPPPLIMIPGNVASKPNVRVNNLPLHNNTTTEKSNTFKNHDVTYTVTKSNVWSSKVTSTAPRVVESEDVQCKCDAKQLVKSSSGKVTITTVQCRLHECTKTKVIENRSLVKSDQVAANLNTVHGNNRVSLNTGPNLNVTSEPSPQNSTGMSSNTVFPSDAKLFLLPSGELAYGVGPNAGSNLLSGNSNGIAIESNFKTPVPNSVSENRFVFSLVDGNSLKTSLLIRSTKPGNDKQFIPKENNETPKPMTIDLTDDDEKSSEVISVPTSPKKYAVQVPTERPKETEAPQTENQTNIPHIMKSVIGKKVAGLSNAVKKQFYSDELGPKGIVKEQINKNNDKGNCSVADSRHAKVVCTSRTPNKKRNSVSAKLSNEQSLAKKSLLKPLDAEVKSGSETTILKNNEEKWDTSKKKLSMSSWLLMGL